MSGTQLWLSMVFSCIGGGYMLYARRRREAAPLIAGLALCIYPYFFSSVLALVGIGVLIMLSPPFIPL